MIESAFFNPDPDDRVRILIKYKGDWKAVFWFILSQDGSIYLAPRIKKPKIMKSGKSISNNGAITVNYSDGIEIPSVKAPKFSFHGSGIINSADSRQYRNSIRDIKEQEALCSVLFQKLDRFDGISEEKLKRKDICLNYPIEDNYPLFMHIFVAPTEKLQVVDMNTQRHQVNLILQYKSIEKVGDISAQICLCTPAEGPWPPYTYILYPTISE